jgi:hypothetical protein
MASISLEFNFKTTVGSIIHQKHGGGMRWCGIQRGVCGIVLEEAGLAEDGFEPVLKGWENSLRHG